MSCSQLRARAALVIPLAVLFMASPSKGSLYDPHPPPAGQLWFEGWYTRVTLDSGDSYGAIVGHFPGQNLKAPNSYAALLAASTNGKLSHYEVMPSSPPPVVVTRSGLTPHPWTDPSLASPPVFEVAMGSNDGKEGYRMEVSGDNVVIRVRAEGAALSIEIESPAEPWDHTGLGPEGWAARLPVLGLEWFVFSVASTATVRYTSPEGHTIVARGHAHLEKNWGRAFPDRWIWAEGIATTATGAVRLALAGGPAPVGPLTIPNAFLIGLRTPRISWNFHPQDPAKFETTISACDGALHLVASTMTRRLEISVIAPASTFTRVKGPTARGFVDDSMESYAAKVEWKAYQQLLGGIGRTLLEEGTITGAALEFGGGYMCPLFKGQS